MIQKLERKESWVGLETIAALAKALETTEIALFQAAPLEHSICECVKRVHEYVTKKEIEAADRFLAEKEGKPSIEGA